MLSFYFKWPSITQISVKTNSYNWCEKLTKGKIMIIIMIIKNVKIIKRIMSEKKIALPSLRNQDWKTVKAQMKEEEIYYSLISRGLFPEEQKGLRQGNKRNRISTIHWWTLPQGEQNETKMYLWHGLTKAYNIVPQSQIIDCLKKYKISNKVIKFIKESMKNWRVELTIGGKSLAEGKIQRGIFYHCYYL